MEQQTIIFLGPQGSGKGTQVQLLKDYLTLQDPSRPIIHIDMGAELRKFVSGGGYTQDAVDASLKRGELQPVFLTGYLVAKAFIDGLKGNEHVIVDGFPRTLENLMFFNSGVSFYKRLHPTLLYVNVSDEEAIKRLIKRGRYDDTEDNIRKRLQWTRDQVMPTVEQFRANPDYRCLEINGEQSVEDVQKEIITKLGLV